MKLSAAEVAILRALAQGDTLKAHRDLEGNKVVKLHPLEAGDALIVEAALVERLTRKRMIDSNKKFPAATFLLTEKGRAVAEKLMGGDIAPLGAENFVR